MRLEELPPNQRAFLEKYVISGGARNPDGPRAKGVNEFSGVSNAAVETAKAVATTYSKWKQRVSSLDNQSVEDRVINYAWLDRDADTYDTMLDRDAGDMPGAIAKAALRRVQEMHDWAKTGLAKAKSDVQVIADAKVKTEWPAAIKEAEGLSGKKLLQAIEALRGEQEQLRVQLDAVGLSRGAADGLDAKIKELMAAYEKGLPEFTAEMKEIKTGDDKAPELKWTKDACRKVYEKYGNNWFTLKKKYKSSEFPKDVLDATGSTVSDPIAAMWQLWAYRKEVVDGKMKDLEKSHGLAPQGKGWVAVGSTNLESDYDISVMQHGRVGEDGPIIEDWKIVKEFNDWFQKEYGTQPGILFDTNLYASAPPPARLADSDAPVGKAMKAMTNSGQDVGALMKQRRFMTWEEYESFMMTVLDGMKAEGADAAQIKATRDQFEEADSRYQISEAQILGKGVEVLEKKLGKDHAATKKVNDLIDRAQKASGAEAQKLMMAAVEELERHEDVMLEVNNDLYVAAMEEVRALEAEIISLSEKVKGAKGEEKTKLEETLQGKIARAKDLACDGVFFANEAYHSDGPFKHIVEATQGVEAGLKAKDKDWDKKSKDDRDSRVDKERKKLRGELSMHSCLQSFNEQLGDFIKDLKHYDHEDLPGSGFYRSSKYLDRLFDAVILLEQKAKDADIAFRASLPGSSKSIAALKSQVANGLLKLRKGAIAVDSEDPVVEAQQAQAYAIKEVRDMFGVSSLGELGKLFKSYGASVNAQLRKVVADEMKAQSGSDKAFFG